MEESTKIKAVFGLIGYKVTAEEGGIEFTSTGPDGVVIHARVVDRVGTLGRLNFYGGALPQARHWKDRREMLLMGVSVQVSAKKSAEVIAADVTMRLLPEYLDVLKRATKYVREANERRDKDEAILADIVGARLTDEEKENLKAWPRGRVRVSVSDGRVKMGSITASPKTAKQIAVLLRASYETKEVAEGEVDPCFSCGGTDEEEEGEDNIKTYYVRLYGGCSLVRAESLKLAQKGALRIFGEIGEPTVRLATEAQKSSAARMGAKIHQA